MRVGIDARRYDRSGRGQERYIRCLIRALAATRSRHEFVLLGRPSALQDIELGDEMRIARADRTLRLQYRRRLAGLRRLLVRNLDLVHFTLADGWYRPPTRSVVTVHDLSVLRFPSAYFTDARAERRARQHHLEVTAGAVAVIAVSESTRKDVIDLLGVPEDKVLVVPHGVDPRFRPATDRSRLAALRNRLGIAAPYLLFVGGIDFKKNVGRLVAGFARARREHRLPHVLVVAGALQDSGNAFFDDARRIAEREGVAEHVVWAGFVPEDDLPALYSGADAFLFPSLWEGFGLPVLEAMACGVPVITSARSAMSEVTEEAAVLVDPSDPAAIADGVITALSDGPALASAGLRRAARYTWERTAARTIEVYEAAGWGRTPSRRVSSKAASPVPTADATTDGGTS